MAGVPGPSHRSRSEARETEILHGGGRAYSDADETQVLRGAPGASAADADRTAVLPSVGSADTRIPGDGSDARRPDSARADGWSAFDRPSARRTDAYPAAGETRSAPAGETRPAPAVRDPWADQPGESERPTRSARSDGPGATHDPHEVTVQLDGVGLHLDNMLRAAKDAPRSSENSDGPVFVDESGRRSRRFRRIGMAVGLACAVYAVVIVATLLSGNSDAPWLPVENPKEKPAGQVDTPPLPAESAPQPSATGSVSPGTSPTASTDATASPGADASASGASATAENPGTSADPKPTATKSITKPGTGSTPDPDPPTQPTTSDPDPSPTDGGGPTEEPTDPVTTDEPASGTVANGPSDPSPLAEGTNASALAAPSPEYTF